MVSVPLRSLYVTRKHERPRRGGGAETGAETVVTQGPRFEILVCPVCLSVTFLFFLPGAPKRRKDREREKIYEPEDVDGGFTEFTLKSARRYEKT